MLDERQFKEQLQGETAKQFETFISNYDESLVPVMKARGYKCVHSMERTVAFTFGEFTFRRRRWKKGTKWVVPVDDKLGLAKHTRYSQELLYQIARLATIMPYAKVVHVIALTYHITITKPTVVKAVKLCGELMAQQADYQRYQDKKIVKQKAKVIYVEGDGVMVRARDSSQENRHIDLSHFVVHTGSQKVGANRFELKDKKEFVGGHNRQVREQVLDYLYQTFEVSNETVLMTNSDGGHGYTPYVFQEFAKALKVGRHEHFWDTYHLNQKLLSFFKPYAENLQDRAFQAIQKHDKGALRCVLDTTEGLLSTPEEEEVFQNLKKKLLRNFQYTKPANLRGLSSAGIGVMESQHRKITYRMKKGGKYWTIKGAETMSQMIVLAYEDRLRDLFFGEWRSAYQDLPQLTGLSGGQVKALESKQSQSTISAGRLIWKNYRP